MDTNVFFDINKKFNPDISNKLSQKKKEREISYTFKNTIDKPLACNTTNVDTPINLKQKQIQLENERSKLDAFIIQNKYNNHKNTPVNKYYPSENITRQHQVKPVTKPVTKSDKILDDLKKLGILN